MASSEAPRSETTISNNATYYGITISKHQKLDYVDKYDLEAILKTLKERLNTLNILYWRFENSGMYGQLHCHAYAKIQEWFKYKNNNSINGYRIQWDKLKSPKDKQRWIQYMNKEVYNKYKQDEVLAINYYHNNYGFIDPE